MLRFVVWTVALDGFYDEEAVWCPAAIACFTMIEQLGLFVACQQRRDCRCYLNGTPLHDDPVAVTHGDFLVIFKSDHAHEGDSLPKKRERGLASAMAWSDVGREVFWSPVQRNH